MAHVFLAHLFLQSLRIDFKKKALLTLPQAHLLVVDVLSRMAFPRLSVLEHLAYHRRRNRMASLSREKKNRRKYDVPRAG